MCKLKNNLFSVKPKRNIFGARRHSKKFPPFTNASNDTGFKCMSERFNALH